MRSISFLLQLIGLFVIATLGYWVWFVNWAPNPTDRVGVTVATLVPGAVKDWGCGKLNARFSAEAPAVCATGSLPTPNSAPAAPSDGATPGGGRL